MDAELIQSITTASVTAALSLGGVFGVQKWRGRNGNSSQSKDVCEERHKGIDQRLASIDKKLDRLLDE